MKTEDANGLVVTFSNGVGWDEYVLNHPKSLFYHLYGWADALYEVFHFQKMYLEARQNDKICGVLPLVLVKTFFGRKLISIPIGVYAGPLTDDNDIENHLLKRAVELTKNLGCDYLELRNVNKINQGFVSKVLYATFIKELPREPQACLSIMPQHARAAVRHAQANSLSCEVDLKYLNDCYEIYAINQRFLGSPIVSKAWFEKLTQVFKDRINILVVKYQGRYIASVLTFFYKDTVLPFYGGCIPEYFKLNPNNYMYLKLQEYATEKGYRYFDFGRSRKGSGSYKFKINQGFEPMQLYYQYYLNKAKAAPDISPSNKAFDLAKDIWRHLPLTLTKEWGPKLFKYVLP